MTYKNNPAWLSREDVERAIKEVVNRRDSSEAKATGWDVLAAIPTSAGSNPIMDKLIEVMARGMAGHKWRTNENKSPYFHNYDFDQLNNVWRFNAQAALSALREAGFVVVPRSTLADAYSYAVQVEQMIDHYGLGKAKPMARDAVNIIRAMIEEASNAGK